MIKKILIAILLTLIVLAFPVRMFNLPYPIESFLKILKGLLFISITLILMKRDGILQKNDIAKKLNADRLIKLIPVLLLITVYLLYSGFKNQDNFLLPAGTFILTLMASFLAASGEEVVMRGYIFNLLRKNRVSLLKSILLSSVIFALLHLINFFRHGDSWSVLNQIIFAFVLGMLFGSIYALTRNLILVSILHFLVNVPSALSALHKPTQTEIAVLDSTLSDNLLSILFMAVLMLPFLMLSFYYIKTANKNLRVASEEFHTHA